MAVIAIDIGGSGSRILATDGYRAKARGPALAAGGHAAVIAALAGAISPAPPVDCVAISAASLISRGDPDALVSAVREHWDARVVVLVSDAAAAVVGAWGESGGAVVAAGTGAVGLGTDLERTWVRSDGWGHELGDEGGAAWIGTRGLRAALRALDGRPGGSPALLEAVRESHGDPASLPALLRAAGNPATMLASFAPAVTRTAHAGDSVAAEIVAEAASLLAATGLSVLTPGVPERLALVGGLSKHPVIAEGFLSAVHARRPALEVVADAGSPLDGALQLARMAAERTLPAHPPYLVVHSHSSHVQGAS
jgi:N-acetylglucosamine kinase-like BadF-type ATPase